VYIYLDESGDLGFNTNSSKHIVIALLITKAPLHIERCIKKIRQRKLKKKLKELPEIKFNKSNDFIREKTLVCIAKEPVEIAYIVLDKDRVNPARYNHKQEIYNFIVGYLMYCLPYGNATQSKLIVDKRISNKIIRADFDEYIKQNTAFKVDITHENSMYNQCLQATDFIAGAIFRKYESGDSRYYDLIGNRIKVSQQI
jgi:patatin-like phospholipase/acyl hydrolase